MPARRRDEGARIERPLTLVASTWFDSAHGYALVQDARDVTYGVPVVADSSGVRRAVAGDGTAAALAAALADPGPSMVASVFHHEPVDGESAIDVDQTNDLVVVGERVVVKWDLHPASGEQAASTRLATLARVGFDGVPRTWGLVAVEAGARFPIATVSEYVPGARDGWEWAVAEVRALARGSASSIEGAVIEVGRLIADLHIALASGGVGRAEEPDVARWSAAARGAIDDAELDPTVAGYARAAATAIGSAVGTSTTAIHGDLHVGQVLRAGDPPRYLVIDFDGNPTERAVDRLAWQPVARDVASMLASWDHVGRVVLHRTDDLDDAARDRVLGWIEWSQIAFLQSYEATLAAAGMADLLDRRLLMPYQLLQECREYAYARRYLPHWRYVPDAALPALIERTKELS